MCFVHFDVLEDLRFPESDRQSWHEHHPLVQKNIELKVTFGNQSVRQSPLIISKSKSDKNIDYVIENLGIFAKVLTANRGAGSEHFGDFRIHVDIHIALFREPLVPLPHDHVHPFAEVITNSCVNQIDYILSV